MGRALWIAVTLGGAVLVWFLKKKGPGLIQAVKGVDIEVGLVGGECGVTNRMRDVTLCKRNRDKVEWTISNPDGSGSCGRDVTVSIEDWTLDKSGPGAPVEDDEGIGLSRVVPLGHRRKIKASIKRGTVDGYYKYSVRIDGHVAVDPMIRIVT